MAWREGRSAEALGHPRALLDPTQQRMPEALAGPLESAPDWERSPPERLQLHLGPVLDAARGLGYL